MSIIFEELLMQLSKYYLGLSGMGWPIPEKFWFEGIHKEYFKSSLSNSKLLKEINTNSDENFIKQMRRLSLANWENVNKLI